MNDIGIALLWCSLQVTIICVVSQIVQRVTSRRAVALRRSVTITTVVLILVTSLLTFSSWPNWTNHAAEPVVVAFRQAAPAMHVVEAATEPFDMPMEIELPPVARGHESGDAATARAMEVTDPKRQTQTSSSPRASTIGAAIATTPQWFVGILLSTAAFGLIRLTYASIAMRRLINSSREITDDQVRNELADLCDELNWRRGVRLLEHSRLQSAATYGWIPATILLPSRWREWSPSDRRVVLSHEMSHVTRYDSAWWLLAQIALVLNFYHPLVHWLTRRLHLEQELVADARAATLNGGEHQYLLVLARLALQQDASPRFLPALGFLPGQHAYARRIEMLRDKVTLQTHPSTFARLGVTSLLMLCGVVALGLRGATAQSESTDQSVAPSTAAADEAEADNPVTEANAPGADAGKAADGDSAPAERAASAYRVDLSKITSVAWKRAIQRATERPDLQRGLGSVSLMRVLLDGVTTPEERDKRLVAAGFRPANADESASPPVVPESVNGVRLFLPDPSDVLPIGPANVKPEPIRNDPLDIQLASSHLCSLQQLYNGGVNCEVKHGDFVLVVHTNSDRGVKVGSYTHGQFEVSLKAPPTGQLGIAGDLILSRTPEKTMGRIVAEVVMPSDDPITAGNLHLGPVVVGGPYGWSYKFDNDGVARTTTLPPGTYEVLLPDFNLAKSRWTVTVKPGRASHLAFTAKSQKDVELTRQWDAPMESAEPVPDTVTSAPGVEN